MRCPLPEEVRSLIEARNRLRDRYKSLELQFTLDGNLIGDLAEAVVVNLLGLKIAHRRGLKGIDAEAADGRTVQIKATGRGHSFAFTHCEPHADWLIAVVLHYDASELEIVYNGPYGPAIDRLGARWDGQKHVRVSRLRELDRAVEADRRLSRPATPLT
ncbi:MAG: DUF6998 domain-containing protein [Bauldia sp.]